MGQYYIVVNLDKREFMHPHFFGDGMKLMELGSGGTGTMLGLVALLSIGNGRGGGDLGSDDVIVGSWAGDRIAVVGGYSDGVELDGVVYSYSKIQDEFDNISGSVINALADDSDARFKLNQSLELRIGSNFLPPRENVFVSGVAR